MPPVSPRNVNWSPETKMGPHSKIGLEKYFLRKVWQGKSETFYENLVLDMLGINKLKEVHLEPGEMRPGHNRRRK